MKNIFSRLQYRCVIVLIAAAQQVFSSGFRVRIARQHGSGNDSNSFDRFGSIDSNNLVPTILPAHVWPCVKVVH